MPFAPVPTQSGIQTALRAFLIQILPTGVEVIEGQDNRVPEPQGTDFVVMTTILRERLETNIDTYADGAFTGSIAGTVMTVTAVQIGAVVVGNVLFGSGVTAGTTITAQTGGAPGGIGTYTVMPSQTVGTETLACGAGIIAQPTKVTVQLDVHSANVQDAADMAQTIATLFRDEYATQFFAVTGTDVTPLYAGDPKQMPFINAEQQYETRYVVDAVLQANQVVGVPQQFADRLTVDLISVEATYTP